MPRNPLTYRDMAIEMTDLRDDASFAVRLYGKAPDGQEMRADQAERPKYVAEDFRRLLGGLQSRKASQEDLKLLGKLLGELLLPGELRHIFDENLRELEKKGEGLRLRLRIEPLSLAALPWEFALVQSKPGESQPTDFLAWRRNVSVTRYETLGAAVGPLGAKEKLRIVAALANPTPADDSAVKLDVLELDPDKEAIEAAISYLRGKTQAVEAEVLENTTRKTLVEKVRNCDIFHFAGHGLFSRDTLSPDGHFRVRGDIVLETDTHDVDLYPSDQLASVLGDAGVRLVVLGACNSASRDEGGAWTGVAPALVRERIPAVVAMQYKLLDATSAAFMPFLYTFVLKGYSIDEAVYEGRRAIFDTVENWAEKGRDWGVPVLYLLAEGGELFPSPADTAAGSAAGALAQVNMDIDTVEGDVIGAEITRFLQNNVNVYQKIKVVRKGGKVVGISM